MYNYNNYSVKSTTKNLQIFDHLKKFVALRGIHVQCILPLHPSILPGLRNDHKAVMRLIEEKLHEIHAETRRRRSESGSGETKDRERPPESLRTFARVSQVTEGSPSALAVRILCNSPPPLPPFPSLPYQIMV